MFVNVALICSLFGSVLLTEAKLHGGRGLATYDCSAGCNLKKKKVCGANGFTYLNECLAICQGVAVAKPGACPGSNQNEKDESFDEAGTVDLATMNRFKDEKYTLVAKRKFLANDVLQASDEQVDSNAAKPPAAGKKLRVSRLASDMYEYAAEVDLADIPAAPEGPPQAGAAGGRDLLVFGADTRTEITSTPAWPVSLNGRTAIGCTGTVISTTSVLTAGHCVYSSGAWRNADFTPAQYRTAANVDVSPYGKWAWSYIQTYTAWTASGDRNYDIAVVKMAPSAKGDIGTYMGYAGLRRSDSCSSYLNNSYNAGYPGDKSNPNNELWRSYCGAVFACVSSTALKTDHTCDTYGGNSGSSMMDASGWVHAVHVAHYLDGHGNIAVLLNGVHYDNVMKWSGRA